ncbi:MAG: hypothetical protein R3C12_03445 [Planctomycetaceae bacterium]
MRQGDWKLIRRFEPHPSYPDLHELYNLKEDLSETNNLARQMPEKVKQLDTLIDQFVKETGALYPKPNPAYAGQRDVTNGLVPRNCRLIRVEGAIQVLGDGRLPFLGTASVKLNGPLKLTLLARCEAGGKAECIGKRVTRRTSRSRAKASRTS